MTPFHVKHYLSSFQERFCITAKIFKFEDMKPVHYSIRLFTHMTTFCNIKLRADCKSQQCTDYAMSVDTGNGVNNNRINTQTHQTIILLLDKIPTKHVGVSKCCIFTLVIYKWMQQEHMLRICFTKVAQVHLLWRNRYRKLNLSLSVTEGTTVGTIYLE
jgi:hypothetical protein